MPRLEFTADTKRQAYKRSGEICECHRIPWLRRPKGCGVKLGTGNTFYEHINPDNIRPDNSLENCAAISRTCFREKTDTYDRKVIAKNNHTRDRARGIDKQQFWRPLPGGKRSNIKLPFRGPPIDRTTGLPWSTRR